MLSAASPWSEKRSYMHATGEGEWDEKIAMALKENNSNEELTAGGRQLLMLLSNETLPLQ